MKGKQILLTILIGYVSSGRTLSVKSNRKLFIINWADVDVDCTAHIANFIEIRLLIWARK